MIYRIKPETMLDHQRKWWELNNFIRLLVGGYGAGKTYIGALRSIYLSYLNKGLPGMYVSPTYKMAKRTILPTLVDMSTKAGLNILHNKTDNEIIIKNWDGIIWIGSGEDPDSLRGPNLAWAGIDEPFIQDKAVLDQMLARIRHPEATKKELFLTGTPEELNWGYDIAMNDKNQYDVGVVRGATVQNTYLPESYFNTLYNAYTPEGRQAYLDGEFVNLKQGRAYKPFDRERHIVSLPGSESWEICAGIDFNVDYMSLEIFRYSNGRFHFIDEIRLDNSNSFEAAKMLQDKYSGIRVFPDATGAARKTSSSTSDHQIFSDHGFRVIALHSNPPVMDRVNTVNARLISMAITIEPGTCSYLVRDLDRVSFRGGDLDQRSDHSLTHASDAAGYAITYLAPINRREAINLRRY